MGTLEEMEQKFLHFTKLNLDLTIFPIKKSPAQQKDKTKSDNFGEVFTPLWLVDKMIQEVPIEDLYQKKATLDLCAGLGQFTIRMMRALYNYRNGDFDVEKWLREVHTLIEIQPGSCFKLLEIFGTGINLFIGDAQKLQEAKIWNDIQIWTGDKWYPIPNIVKAIKEIKLQFKEEIKQECAFSIRLTRVLSLVEKQNFIKRVMNGIPKEYKQSYAAIFGSVITQILSEKEQTDFIKLFKNT